MSGLPPDALPTYACGRPIREGDHVRFDGGVRARVSEVLAAPQGAARGYSGAGVVVDAPPRGYVFLSTGLLREEPLEFLSRGPGERVRLPLSIALAVGWLVALPVLYSFFSAAWQAFDTGEVLVISIGRSEVHTERVPWLRGWPRFVAPLLLLLSLQLYDGSRGATLRWWTAGVAAAAALVLLGQSWWFSSVQGSLAFLLFSTWMGAVLAIAHRLGRLAAYVFILLSAASLLARLV